MIKKKCEVCGVEFETKIKNKILCGDPECVKIQHCNKKIHRLNLKNGTNLPLKSRSVMDIKIDKKIEVIKNDDRRTRKCLRCNKEFLSEWSGNRLCTICVEKNNNLHE